LYVTASWPAVTPRACMKVFIAESKLASAGTAVPVTFHAGARRPMPSLTLSIATPYSQRYGAAHDRRLSAVR
jgi:hypothetical protein